MHVADFGTGRTGHIVFPAAVMVGAKGVVYAVDILREALESVHKRALLEGLTHIHPVWGNVEVEQGVAIPSKSIDVVFMINALHRMENHTVPLNEAKRLLKEKSRLIIVDWVETLPGLSPPNEKFIDFSALAAALRQDGWAIQENTRLGNYHHLLIAYRHDEKKWADDMSV
jgi:ubiquinone/menaquinone biosynthesis C-methylase UbiE